ncbi:MAG: ATP-binding protein [Planctomycetota bacterium]
MTDPTPDILNGWMDISEEGFALENAGRPPAHLAKELVQNALDAIEGVENGHVDISVSFDEARDRLVFRVRDNGQGIPADRITSIRTVFWTSKRDDPTRRGRMGRGFKEPLSMADAAIVASGRRALRFVVENDQRVTRLEQLSRDLAGTTVEMLLRWGAEQVDELTTYFARFVVPTSATLSINGEALPRREPVHVIEDSIQTEIFKEGTWRRPRRKTTIELLPVADGEPPTIFEMGIPVCALGWKQPFHANVRQRVPMNPRRDMTLPGYPEQIHKAALPALLPTMTQEEILTDWVGAVAQKVPEDVQKDIINRGLGENVVRSVPAMGRRDFDADAPRFGLEPVDVRRLPGGLGAIVREHVPSAKQAVEQREAEERLAAAQQHISLDNDADLRAAAVADHIRKLGGREHVQLVMDWARWMITQLLELYPDPPVVAVRLALFGDDNTIATWSNRDELTLALDHAPTWRDPFGADTFRTLIHESAHHRNAHHGARFSQEVEVLAGRAAWIVLTKRDEILERFGALRAG